MVRVEEGTAVELPSNKKGLETVIDGSTERGLVEKAVNGYSGGLKDFLTIKGRLARDLGIHPDDITLLEQTTAQEVDRAAEYTTDVVLELNERYRDKRSERYKELQKRDKSLWNKKGHAVEEGVMLCVDQGLVTEVYPPDTLMGRSLAGNTAKQFIELENRFVMDTTFMKKALIHEQRQQELDGGIQSIVVHTGCGRVGQMLGNTHNPDNFIPSFNPYFDHVDALTPEFSGDSAEVHTKLQKLKAYWKDRRPDTGTLPITDEGRLAAVLQKVAKRQALKREIDVIPTEMPIKLIDKRDLNVFTGLDNIDNITDEKVLQAGGYTDSVLDELVNEGRVFSLRHRATEIYSLLEQGNIRKGSRTYQELQEDWLTVQEELVDVTSNLWDLYDSDSPQAAPLKNAVDHYLSSIGKTNHIEVTPAVAETMQRRLVHDLFHITAYTYLLNTFEKGNDPGHHMEGHLETGNPDEGAKKKLGLGQGELDEVNALNVFTEYAVLNHSTPGETGAPVPALLRLDTERPSTERMTMEETVYAQSVLRECLKLWPYMLVGDIIPFLVVRAKQEGGNAGISRMPLSTLKTFDNMSICYERGDLPKYTPAANSHGEVVLVPASAIVKARVDCLKQGGGLKEFRHDLLQVADLIQ